MARRSALLLELSLTTALGVGACGDPAAPKGEPSVAARPPQEVAPPEPAVARDPGPSEFLDEVDATPPTDLPLALLATLAAKEPTSGRATIRNDAGLIATYRVGEIVFEGAALTAVHPDYVLLERDGTAERLDFPYEMITLEAGDTFYPDFAELDHRSNVMSDALQLVKGPGYRVKKPVFAWGTPRTVTAIREAVQIYRTGQSDAPPVNVGDISKQQGGPFPPHLSHQTGRDVDIGYVHTGRNAERPGFVTATARTLDRARTYALLQAFVETGAVSYVFVDYGLQKLLYEHALEQGVGAERLAEFFQYPRGSAASKGIIRHWRGHANHFHVRFRAG